MTSAAFSMTAAKRAAWMALALASIAAVPSVARADGAANPSHADALFREGRTLLDAKRYDEACPKLAASQKEDPGAGTLLALALCHEGQGKTATAWNDLNEAAALGKKVGRNDLAAAAQKRAQAMEPLLSRLVVRVPHADDADHADYEVKRDGEPLEPKMWGTAVVVDPGEHRVEVSAKGKTSRSYGVRITGAGVVEIIVDNLEDAGRPVVAAAPAKAAPTRIRLESTVPAAPAEESHGGAQRTIGLTLIGLGVVGLGTGAYFGGKALSESAEGRRACTVTPCPPDQKAASTDANDRAKSSFTTSVVSVAAGTGALTIGMIVYFLAPSATSTGTAPAKRMTARFAPSVSPTEASVGVTGAF
ncbi:MAG: hypothetical protein JWO86_6060 [Myxococcaceae bacterium]|jgi:hypothetical protein|nr:hypothetical protein [Myxococcaceae bacterium]